MTLLTTCIAIFGSLLMQVPSTAPVAPDEPASTVVSIFIIIAIIVALVMYGFCGFVFARFALKQGWCAALVIIFFWLGVFLSPFVLVPIIVVYIYKHTRKSIE